MSEPSPTIRLIDFRDASNRLTITLSDDARDFARFSRLTAKRFGAPLEQLDGLDQRYCDFLVNGGIVVLHSDTFMGVSLYAEDGQRDLSLRGIAMELLHESSPLGKAKEPQQ